MPRKATSPDEKAVHAMKKGKKPPTQLALKMAPRLRAIQAELRKTDEQMATCLSVGRSRWTNWVNAENLPAEEAMVVLCEKAKVTMDWLYRGDGDRIELRHIIRLTARVRGMDPDTATPEILAR